MTLLMEILKTYIEEQLLMKHCLIKHLILLKIRNIMDINVDLLQWFIIFLRKKTSGSGIKNENMSEQQLAEELHNQLLKNLKKEKYTHLL